jgi:hypothetical protein
MLLGLTMEPEATEPGTSTGSQILFPLSCFLSYFVIATGKWLT